MENVWPHFFRSQFTPVLDVTEDGYQMSKVEYQESNVISVYRTSNSNQNRQQISTNLLMSLVTIQKNTFILGLNL